MPWVSESSGRPGTQGGVAARNRAALCIPVLLFFLAEMSKFEALQVPSWEPCPAFFLLGLSLVPALPFPSLQETAFPGNEVPHPCP